MSYYPPPQQGYPPYGGPPPQQGYNPSPQPGYNQYPPPHQPSPGQYPPQNQYQSYGQYPPQVPPHPGQYGSQQQYPSYGGPPPGPPPPPNYGQQQPGYPPQQQYGAPPQQYSYSTPASLGYAPQNISWDANPDADALRKAMKGFGTDERTLIRVLATKDPLQATLLRQTYNHRFGRNLEKDIEGETSGYFEYGLLALTRGPLQQDVHVLHSALSGPGTKESALNDVLLSRSNADMIAIKEAYRKTHGRNLETDVKSDLSMKTERHFMMVLAADRFDESAQPAPHQIEQDVMDLYKATEGKMGTDELLVCSIMSTRNDAQIRAIAQTYEQRFRRSLETVIKKEFSGHMEKALLHQLRGGTDRAMRDACLLEDAMSGAGTKDQLLVNRIVQYHWDRNHMQQVRGAYRHRFHKDLSQRIKGETSGDYERLMLACIGEPV